MKCPTCSTDAIDEAQFCTSCGAHLQPGTEATGVIGPVVDGTEALSRVAPSPEPASGTPSEERRPSQPAATGELVACSACGAENSAARVLCARCGVDLASGQRPVAAPVVHHPGPADDVVGEVTPPRGSSGGRTAAVVAAIIVVGAVVGVLVGLWVVDAGREPEPVAPTFDAAAYDAEPEALTVVGVGASSQRPPAGDVTYDAGNMVDGDVTTAWSHDPAVEVVDDVDLAFALADPSWVTALTFANGAQTDDLAFAADGRILRLALLRDGEPVVELQLLDQQGFQQVTLPEPQLLAELRLVVLEAVPGDTYDDVSISEVIVIGHPARGEDLARVVEG